MGTAQVEGGLWGTQARHYAEIAEKFFRPVYERVFKKARLGPGTKLLDVGCGPGLAAQMAAQRGARVSGLDAADVSLAIARERTPGGDFRLGDMEQLPYEDHSFDVVTLFNSVQFAADTVQALREAARVARRGGVVAVVIWGPPEDNDITTVMSAVRELLLESAPRPETPIYEHGRLEELMEKAGLTPVAAGELNCAFDYPDLETAVQGIMSPGPAVAAVQQVGYDAVRRAVVDSLAAFQTDEGGYNLSNRLRYVIARV